MDNNLNKLIYKEMNKRSRWYSTQLWAIPITILIILLEYFKGMLQYQPTILEIILIIFIVYISNHWFNIKYREQRAIKCMKNIEKEWKLKIECQSIR